MSPVEAVRSAGSKLLSIEGRAPRSEYWWFLLFLVTTGVGLSLLASAIGLDVLNRSLLGFSAIGWVSLFAQFSVTVRRGHDTGRPTALLGTLFSIMVAASIAPSIASTMSTDMFLTSIYGLAFMGAATLVLVVYLIVLMVLPSNPEANNYGPNPLRVTQVMPPEFPSP